MQSAARVQPSSAVLLPGPGPQGPGCWLALEYSLVCQGPTQGCACVCECPCVRVLHATVRLFKSKSTREEADSHGEILSTQLKNSREVCESRHFLESPWRASPKWQWLEASVCPQGVPVQVVLYSIRIRLLLHQFLCGSLWNREGMRTRLYS